ncbi:MAG: hypothetical protein AAGA56_05215 [Myxococcota bacterium]
MAFSYEKRGFLHPPGGRHAARIAEKEGHVDAVVSTPFPRLPLKPLAAAADEDWSHVLTRDDFADLVRDQLSHHFRVAKVAALSPRCQVVLVVPETSRGTTREEFALPGKGAGGRFDRRAHPRSSSLPSETSTRLVLTPRIGRRGRGEQARGRGA